MAARAGRKEGGKEGAARGRCARRRRSAAASAGTCCTGESVFSDPRAKGFARCFFFCAVSQTVFPWLVGWFGGFSHPSLQYSPGVLLVWREPKAAACGLWLRRCIQERSRVFPVLNTGCAGPGARGRERLGLTPVRALPGPRSAAPQGLRDQAVRGALCVDFPVILCFAALYLCNLPLFKFFLKFILFLVVVNGRKV